MCLRFMNFTIIPYVTDYINELNNYNYDERNRIVRTEINSD